MNRFLLIALGAFVAAQSLTADAKPKGKGKGKGVPPGQVRKAEVHDALARGESPSRKHKAPPARVYQNWDRDRVYYWEDNRYRWRDGGWVIYLD